MLIVDLRRPVEEDAFRRALAGGPVEDVFALTPLAGWLLEQAGLPHRTGGDLADKAWFQAEGLRNTDRTEEAFAACFGAETDSWRGLLNRVKTLLDYALVEEKRWTALEVAGGRVIADVPQASRESLSWEDHYYNRASLYFWGAASFAEVPRRVGGMPTLAGRLLNLTPAVIADKALDRLAVGRRPALLTRYNGDWGAHKPWLRRRFGAVSPERLAHEALAASTEADDGRAEPEAAALVDAVRSRVAGLVPRALAGVMAILENEATVYARLRRRLAGTAVAAARRHEVRAALSVAASGYEEYLIHHYLKAAGIPTLFHQHGAYMSRPMFMRSAEAAPATHNFAYGSADVGFYEALGARSVVKAGCTGLTKAALPAPGSGRFLYVLLHVEGNALNVTSRLHFPDTDATASFRRHRRVAELFGRRQGVSLSIREHPASSSWCLYEPLSEFIAGQGFTNVRLDRSPGPTSRFLQGYDGVILDYVCTTAIVSVAAGQRIACYLGPFGLDPDGEAVLRSAAECAPDDDAFIALLERWLGGASPKTDPAARKRFIELYAGEPGGREGEAQLRRLLGLETGA